VTTTHTRDVAFRSLLSEHNLEPNAISAWLDGLSSERRISEVRSLRRAELQRLFGLVANFAPLTLEHLVPKGSPPLAPVRHYGRNSLPMFTLFEKRFYRLPTADAVGGANFQASSWLTGPGYFVARPAAQSGELVIDYQQLPEQAPAGWPALAGNDNGIARMVYGGGTVDTLRRVSQHVSIGAAAKGGGPAVAYFVLCREA
jgi:hypothetical protein